MTAPIFRPGMLTAPPPAVQLPQQELILTCARARVRAEEVERMSVLLQRDLEAAAMAAPEAPCA